MTNIKAIDFRKIAGICTAVFASAMLSHYFSFSEEGWIVISAFLVCFTTRGAPLRQAIIFFMTIFAAVAVAAILTDTTQNKKIVYLFLGVIFILSGYAAFISRPQQNRNLLRNIIFSFLIIAAALSPLRGQHAMYERFTDILTGTLIGVLCAYLIFPMRIEKEFRLGIVPVFDALLNYTKALAAGFSPSGDTTQLRSHARLELENVMQTQHGMYPEWVFEVGFNPGVRGGYRFFLVHLDRLIELYITMDYLLSKPMAEWIVNAMQKNEELLMILHDYFKSNKFTAIKSDFTTDITELEKELHRAVPDNIELLDVSPDYLTLTALVRNIKDSRHLLLQLTSSLPAG